MTTATNAGRPTISLIIPAYNEEAYLPACLDAVMANVAGKAIEIIVVDHAEKANRELKPVWAVRGRFL